MTPEKKESFKDNLDRMKLRMIKDVERDKLYFLGFELLAALEEAQQQLESANVIIKGHEINADRKQQFIVEQAKYGNEIGIQLREANQTISKQREALQSIYEESEDIGARHCAADALGIEWEGEEADNGTSNT